MTRKRRILIVDDNAKWREELSESLEDGEYIVDCAATSAETFTKLDQSLFHMVVLDIRLDGTSSNPDAQLDGGITILKELDRRGLSEATKVIMLSAYGTQEQMRMAFSKYKVVDFLTKDHFNNREFLEFLAQIFVEKVQINLDLTIHWPPESQPEQFVLNLQVDGTQVKRGTSLHTQLVTELDDLLCRLFASANGIIIRPLMQGKSGTGVIRVQPFYLNGAGHEVLVKFGDFHQIEEEYQNFLQSVQPFIGGAHSTSVLTLRHTTHLGGIVYNLLGTERDHFTDFGSFYQRASLEEITDALDRLFRDTCGAWYANPGTLQPLDLTKEYQGLFGYSPEKLFHL